MTAAGTVVRLASPQVRAAFQNNTGCGFFSAGRNRFKRGGVLMRLSKLVMALGAAVVSSQLASVNAVAADFEWKFNNGLPETRGESKELNAFAEAVSQATDGRLKIQVYHGGSLGLKNEDVLRWLPSGVSEMGLVWANYVGRDAPELNAIYIQGSVGSPEEHLRALPVIQEIYQQEFGKWGIVTAGFMALPMLEASIFCTDAPVRTLADLKEKKLRVWSKDQVDTFERLGVSAQIIPQTEMYVALRTGVVDCAVYPALFAHTVSLQEVARYASYLYPIASLPYVLGVSEQKWTELPDDLKQAVQDAAADVWSRTNEYADDHEKELNARKKLVGQGMEWLDDFPAADQRAFLDAAAETWLAAAKDAGGEAPAYRDRVLTAIGR